MSRQPLPRQPRQPASDRPASEAGIDVHEMLALLPTRLGGARLPDGVIELIVEDFESPTRQLLDVRSGDVRIIEPGTAVPWASISGPATAWAVALGPDRDVGGLELTGDQHLARRVLGAFPTYA